MESTPDLALERLHELARGVRDAVVLDAEGRLLAGSEDLAEPAAALMRATDSAAVEIADPRGAVYGVRSGGRAIVAVVDPPSLPSLMLYDLRAILDGLPEPRAA